MELDQKDHPNSHKKGENGFSSSLGKDQEQELESVAAKKFQEFLEGVQ